MNTATNGKGTALAEPTNDAAAMIAMTEPYIVEVDVLGTAPILFHRWSNEAVAEKAAAAKGSKAKKSDDVESYVYRLPDGTIGIPGTYLIGSMIDKKNGAAKYRQDPRSPRKSALDLFKAGVVALTDLAPILTGDGAGTPCDTWDYLDARRVTVQQSAITRVRPAFMTGWRAQFLLSVLTPEYIPPSLLLDVLTQAGKLVGLADFRPTFGRFQITRFEVAEF